MGCLDPVWQPDPMLFHRDPDWIFKVRSHPGLFGAVRSAPRVSSRSEVLFAGLD